MHRKPLVIIAALSMAVSVPALADDAAPATQPQTAAVQVKAGQFIRDADNRRIGAVDSVRGDQVIVITSTKMVRIPLSTVSVEGSGPKTNLKLAQLR